MSENEKINQDNTGKEPDQQKPVLEILFNRAEMSYQRNELAKALNDYEQILRQDPENKMAATKIEMIKTILRYNNTDIYANPNTDMDPWLE